MNSNSIDACNYKIDEPYPPVRVDGPNPVYACEMLGNMADVVSEMSGIALYFYVSVVAKPQYDWVSTCFHHIGIVEMHHLDTFADLALLLGADPRLWSGQPGKRWWSPSFICYPREIRALIGESIKSEEAAIRKYSRQANSICDPNIVAILRRIIRDEERHLEIFSEMCRQI